MKKSMILSILLFGAGLAAVAQDSSSAEVKPYRHNFDLAVSAAAKQFSGALSWSQLYGIGKGKKRFKIGYGLRFTTFVGANPYYTTAPSKYTSPVQGLGTIFSETIDANIDTVAFQTSQVNALNAAIYLQYTILKKWDVGFNIDAIGFSFGGKQQGNVISSTLDPNQAPVVASRPTTLNLLLTSDNDIGTLNSEFYIRYWLTERWALKAGYTFLFTEYTTDSKLSFNNGSIQNDRYRLKSSLVMLGVTWRPFH